MNSYLPDIYLNDEFTEYDFNFLYNVLFANSILVVTHNFCDFVFLDLRTGAAADSPPQVTQ